MAWPSNFVFGLEIRLENIYVLLCRWPLIVDTSGQAATFLRYRDTNFINALSPRDVEPERIRLSILGALRSVHFSGLHTASFLKFIANNHWNYFCSVCCIDWWPIAKEILSTGHFNGNHCCQNVIISGECSNVSWQLLLEIKLRFCMCFVSGALLLHHLIPLQIVSAVIK